MATNDSEATKGAQDVNPLAAAAAAAARAPSIHNTQPWHWRIRGEIADLHGDTRRQLNVTDPDRRLLTVSCGVALHHALIALTAAGESYELELLPSPGNPMHLARVRHTGIRPVPADVARLFEAMARRHTDRRPLKPETVPPSAVKELENVASHYLSGLQPLDRDQVLELADAITRAQRDEIDDAAARRELDAVSGIGPTERVGVPDANIPTRPTNTTVPTRDFGHVGTLPINDRNDHAATYAIVYGFDDDPRAWLRAGQALSAVWLEATDRRIALLPLSVAVEEAGTRQMLNNLLPPNCHAQIAIRLGIADATQGAAPRTPRLATSETITTSA
jgi:hypothetical protein